MGTVTREKWVPLFAKNREKWVPSFLKKPGKMGTVNSRNSTPVLRFGAPKNIIIITIYIKNINIYILYKKLNIYFVYI